MPGADVGAIATACLDAWTSGDYITARSLLRDDVSSVSPLGVSEGAERYMAELEALGRIVTGNEQRRVMVDGEDVCIFCNLVTVPAGSLPTSSLYHIQDGKIGSVRAYFDAGLLEGGRRPPTAATVAGRSVVGGEAPLVIPIFVSAEMEIAEWDSP